jgi:hypothetical protein
MKMSELHDAEFKYMRGTGRKRHREVCFSNAQADNEEKATMAEPRCKVCERKLEIELRK